MSIMVVAFMSLLVMSLPVIEKDSFAVSFTEKSMKTAIKKDLNGSEFLAEPGCCCHSSRKCVYKSKGESLESIEKKLRKKYGVWPPPDCPPNQGCVNCNQTFYYYCE